jgi:hypothetical protein
MVASTTTHRDVGRGVLNDALLEPRLYRAAFVPAFLALVILMFSLEARPPAYAPGLQPPPFSGTRVALVADQLLDRFGARVAGSRQDRAAASYVAEQFAGRGFTTHSYEFRARTVDGRKRLTNVVGVRPGLSDRRIVVVASRDGVAGSYEGVGSYETATLLEFARVLEGRSLQHTLVLASVDGGVSGTSGAGALARSLRGPVDAVLSVRNLPGDTTVGEPILADADDRYAPATRLVRTGEASFRVELRRRVGSRSLAAQLVRMGFPVALGEQAAFIDYDRAAISFSPAGEPLVTPGERAVTTAGAAGRAVLRTLLALDRTDTRQGLERPALVIGGKRIPGWSITLLVGMLILPLLVVAVDSWARARRRGESSVRGIAAPLVAMVPIVAAALLLRALGAAGVIDAPALPTDPAAYSGAVTVVIGTLLVVLVIAALIAVGRLSAHAAGAGGEAGLALWIAVTVVAAFALNPVAAAFALPAAHTALLLLLAGEAPGPRRVVGAVAFSLLPLVLVIVYFPVALEMGVFQSVWFATLLHAGGFISPPALIVEAAFVAGIVAATGMAAGRGRAAQSVQPTLGPAFQPREVGRG